MRVNEEKKFNFDYPLFFLPEAIQKEIMNELLPFESC
jgi:hypothetical protein